MIVKVLHRKYSVKDLHLIADRYDAEIRVFEVPHENRDGGKLQHFAYAVEDIDSNTSRVYTITLADILNKALGV